jgi:hypothetical protein
MLALALLLPVTFALVFALLSQRTRFDARHVLVVAAVSCGIALTHVLRQLHMSPWAEFAITHLQLLTGGDRFANIVQWSGLVGCAVVGTATARELGAPRMGQMISAVSWPPFPWGFFRPPARRTTSSLRSG